MYILNRDRLTGAVDSITKQIGNTVMGFTEKNDAKEYGRFLEWNALQPVPLDISVKPPIAEMQGPTLEERIAALEAKVFAK